MVSTACTAIETGLKNEFGNQICFRVYKKRLFDEIEFPIGRYYEDIATFYKLMLKADNILMIDYEYYIYNIWNIVYYRIIY